MTANAIALSLAQPAIAMNRFALALSALDIRMPLRHDATHCGTIVDAAGNMVFVVDMNNERPDVEVNDIVELLLLAINVHAGHLPGGDIHG